VTADVEIKFPFLFWIQEQYAVRGRNYYCLKLSRKDLRIRNAVQQTR
jgi:hypothetical protein